MKLYKLTDRNGKTFGLGAITYAATYAAVWLKAPTLVEILDSVCGPQR